MAEIYQSAIENKLSVEASRLGWAKRALLVSSLVVGTLLVNGDVMPPDELLLTHDDSQPLEENVVTVMTANVRSWDGPNKSNFDNFKRALTSKDIDIACIQEYSDEKTVSRDLYAMGYDVYFSKTVQFPTRARFGNAIISKSRISYTRTTELPSARFSPRIAMSADIAAGDSQLTVTNTHLSTHDAEKAQQTSYISPLIESDTDIACGDFNQEPDLIADGALGGFASTALYSAARSNTFPSSTPDREIDYIFTRCGRFLYSQQELAYVASDHLARIQHLDVRSCLDD